MGSNSRRVAIVTGAAVSFCVLSRLVFFGVPFCSFPFPCNTATPSSAPADGPEWQSGMGEGLARDLISKGWAVACIDVQEQAGKALVAELGPNAHFVKCDIADYDDQARMYTEVWKKWGRLDALLANAGIVDRSSIYILDHRNSDR
jgi:hypothetical protein